MRGNEFNRQSGAPRGAAGGGAGVAAITDRAPLFVLLEGLKSREPLIVITGPAGAGKTDLLRRVLPETERENLRIMWCGSPGGEPITLAHILLDVASELAPAEALENASNAPAPGRHAVAVIDDAHLLTAEAAAYLASLLEPGFCPAGTIQLLLVGRPELWRLLADTGLATRVGISGDMPRPRSHTKRGSRRALPVLAAALAVAAGGMFFARLADERKQPAAALPASVPYVPISSGARQAALPKPRDGTNAPAVAAASTPPATAAISAAVQPVPAPLPVAPLALATPVAPPVAPPAAPENRPRPQPQNSVAAISQGEIGDLLHSGEMMLVRGDIPAARAMYRKAAEANSAEAAVTLAKSYDPIFLASIDASAYPAKIALAARWYRRAIALGDPEAPARLSRLQSLAGQPEERN